MTADYTPEGIVANEDDAGRTPQDWGRYREVEKKVRTAEQKAKDLERENAFLKAGINPADEKAPPHTQLFVDGYKGDLDPKAIIAEAIKMNILKPKPAPTDPATQPANAQAAQGNSKIDNAANGAQPAEGGGTNVERIDQAFEEGGVDGMAAELAKQGIPTVHSP